MQRTLNLSRDVLFLMLPLGRSLPCRVLATVLVALLSGAAMATADAPAGSAATARPAVAGR